MGGEIGEVSQKHEAIPQPLGERLYGLFKPKIHALTGELAASKTKTEGKKILNQEADQFFAHFKKEGVGFFDQYQAIREFYSAAKNDATLTEEEQKVALRLTRVLYGKLFYRANCETARFVKGYKDKSRLSAVEATRAAKEFRKRWKKEQVKEFLKDLDRVNRSRRRQIELRFGLAADEVAQAAGKLGSFFRRHWRKAVQTALTTILLTQAFGGAQPKPLPETPPPSTPVVAPTVEEAMQEKEDLGVRLKERKPKRAVIELEKKTEPLPEFLVEDSKLRPEVTLVDEQEWQAARKKGPKVVATEAFDGLILFPSPAAIPVYAKPGGEKIETGGEKIENLLLAGGGVLSPKEIVWTEQLLRLASDQSGQAVILRLKIPWAKIPDPRPKKQGYVYLPLVSEIPQKATMPEFRPALRTGYYSLEGYLDERRRFVFRLIQIGYRVAPFEEIRWEGEKYYLWWPVVTAGEWKEYKIHNLTNAAARLNGTVLQPGERKRLSEIIGPITKENGYVEGGILVKKNGEVKGGKAVGGGLCAAASAVAGAMAFWVESTAIPGWLDFRPHSSIEAAYGGNQLTAEAGIPTPIDVTLWEDSDPVIFNPTGEPMLVLATLEAKPAGPITWRAVFKVRLAFKHPPSAVEIDGPFLFQGRKRLVVWGDYHLEQHWQKERGIATNRLVPRETPSRRVELKRTPKKQPSWERHLLTKMAKNPAPIKTG